MSKPIGSRLRDHYYDIRYEVFAVEMRWNLARVYSPPSASAFDHGVYSILYDPNTSEPVAAVRGVSVSLEFPHANLFSHHQDSDIFRSARKSLCTINGLAVKRGYRGSRFTVSPGNLHGGAGSILMMSVLSFFQGVGLSGCLLTAGSERALRFFENLGFHVIDPARATDLHPDPLVNMGLCFSSKEYINALTGVGLKTLHKPGQDNHAADAASFIVSRTKAMQGCFGKSGTWFG